MRVRTVVLIVLALAFGGSASLGVHRWQLSRQAGDVDTVAVLTAATDVPRGTKLTSDAIKVKQWPKAMVPKQALTDAKAIEGQTVKIPLVSGEPILMAKLTKGAIGSNLSNLIPPGMRAFAIRTPHIAAGVGGFIQPDDRVDVLLTTTSRDEATGGSVTTTLLQNIQILAVDQEMDANPDGDKDVRLTVKSVTLLVAPDQAAKLALATDKGLLNLSLRNHGDALEAKTRPATLSGLRYDQDPPREASQVGSIFSRMAGAVASAALASSVQAAPALAKKRIVKGRIQTLRGVHRGTVHVQMVK